MKLKEKIKAIPSYFSYRQKVTLVSILGVIAGLCILLTSSSHTPKFASE